MITFCAKKDYTQVHLCVHSYQATAVTLFVVLRPSHYTLQFHTAKDRPAAQCSYSPSHFHLLISWQDNQQRCFCFLFPAVKESGRMLSELQVPPFRGNMFLCLLKFEYKLSSCFSSFRSYQVCEGWGRQQGMEWWLKQPEEVKITQDQKKSRGVLSP